MLFSQNPYGGMERGGNYAVGVEFEDTIHIRMRETTDQRFGLKAGLSAIMNGDACQMVGGLQCGQNFRGCRTEGDHPPGRADDPHILFWSRYNAAHAARTAGG